jgi:hypothetical protein
MRRFARIVCFALGGAGGLALAGCTPTGQYNVSWNFFARADKTGGTQDAPAACGMHGVDAILIQGTSGSNGATEIWLCTKEQFTGTVGTGDWTFQLQGLDVRGTRIGDQQTTTTMTVSQGAPAAMFPQVTFTPRPECSDGIDNDGDGLVDKDDPGCANFDPNNPQDTTLESSAGPGSPTDGGQPTDAGVVDGSPADGGATDGTAPDAPSDGPDLDGAAPEAGPADAGSPDDAAAGG